MAVIALLLISFALKVLESLVTDYNVLKWLSPYIRHIKLANVFLGALITVLSM